MALRVIPNLTPLLYNPFDPDIILIYANPAQIILMINAIQHEKYEVMDFYCVGESSCSEGIVRCYETGKPGLSIPCYGERRYGQLYLMLFLKELRRFQKIIMGL
ncbi:MAG: DUF169 domain-containing protein [Desulfobacterales bacterium]|nr:DUF169 domain-containing protein [Desulfobacterales bacterium]MCP4163838.1 DUF169 domain-containing protein [Deltaproteobacteria bacterium]